jgi:hypothetical protein
MSTELQITSVLTSHDAQKTTVTVTVLEDVAAAPGLSVETGRYKVVLEALYTDTDDPAMLAAVAEKLALVA